MEKKRREKMNSLILMIEMNANSWRDREQETTKWRLLTRVETRMQTLNIYVKDGSDESLDTSFLIIVAYKLKNLQVLRKIESFSPNSRTTVTHKTKVLAHRVECMLII